MDAMLDTLAASRKLEESGMPEPQAGAVVEVMNDAVKNLVTKEYLKTELDSRFSKFERKIERKIDRKFEEHFGEVDGKLGKMDENFEKVDERFEKIHERFEKVDERFEKIHERFEKVDERFEKIDERFEKIDEKFEKTNANINELRLSIAELGKSQAWGFVYVCGITVAVAALLFSALQFFGTGAAAAPVNVPDSGAYRIVPPEFPATPPGDDLPPPEVTLEPDPTADL